MPIDSILEEVATLSEVSSEPEDQEFAHDKETGRKINKFYAQEELRKDLHEIIAQMMTKDSSAIDMLMNNAKTIGGVIGATEGFFDKKKKDHDDFFLEQQTLQVQDITFPEIARTTLGKRITHQI